MGERLRDELLDGEILHSLPEAQVAFTDAGEHALALPVSCRGLAQALDGLARETAEDQG